MLNVFNNYSLLDNNLFNYGLILGSVSIIGFSIYYFSGYLFKNSIIDNVSTTSSEMNITDQVNNTKYLVETGVQTDQAMLYDYMKELLYNDATPTTSLGEISVTDFVRDYKNDPALTNYFDNTAKWAESISRQSSGTSANSDVLFLRKVGEDLKTITELIQNNLSSEEVGPVTKILAPHNTELYPSYDGWLNEIFNKIINLQDKITDIEQLRKLIELYSIVPNEVYNVDYVSTLIICGSI